MIFGTNKLHEARNSTMPILCSWMVTR